MPYNYSLDEKLLSYLRKEEGFANEAYYDQHGYSIGYGHYLGDQEKDGMPPVRSCSINQAENWLQSDTARVAEISNYSEIPNLTQSMFDGLSLFGYNAGQGRQQRLIDLINSGDIEAAKAYQKSIIHDAKGNVLPDLVTRRSDEASMIWPSVVDKLGRAFGASPIDKIAGVAVSTVIMGGFFLDLLSLFIQSLNC